MNIKVLSGIANPVLDELLEQGSRTIEIRSANNVLALKDVSTGNYLLLSNKKFHDIDKGTKGLIAKVERIKKSMHHISYKTESIYEERETSIVRTKIKLAGKGIIKKILNKNKGIKAKVEEKIGNYNAG